jgi:hypothetical protein
MRTLAELRLGLAGAVGALATYAPDEFPKDLPGTYESATDFLRTDWHELRPKIKRDTDKIAFIDAKIQEAYAAFESGDKKKGRAALWEVYNLRLQTLR